MFHYSAWIVKIVNQEQREKIEKEAGVSNENELTQDPKRSLHKAYEGSSIEDDGIVRKKKKMELENPVIDDYDNDEDDDENANHNITE